MKAIEVLRKVAWQLRDGDVRAAPSLMRQADALLERPGAAPEPAYRARIALAAAIVALAAGDGGRVEGQLSEALRLLGME